MAVPANFVKKKVLILLPENVLNLLMRIRLIQLLVALTMLSMGSVANAQDPGFSQFYGNPVYLNPALAGNKICPGLH
jgi:hypothetical protein